MRGIARLWAAAARSLIDGRRAQHKRRSSRPERIDASNIDTEWIRFSGAHRRLRHRMRARRAEVPGASEYGVRGAQPERADHHHHRMPGLTDDAGNLGCDANTEDDCICSSRLDSGSAYGASRRLPGAGRRSAVAAATRRAVATTVSMPCSRPIRLSGWRPVRAHRPAFQIRLAPLDGVSRFAIVSL